eukprot:CAMPEP_0114246116 /NCGR_PEP_ID=MMETSP0058-20121206/12274_1 /TAXON_ID=36894 /ORGANISM="Pyramimonas parkeae, CCMP726" /LENGTH=525 /DNA_ID=CAMNT_0001359247 /DNA_START=43 /DNA_END=1620 /DNA_ORIENTATION=+
MAMGSLTFSAPMMGKNLSYQSQRLSQSRITLARTTVTRRTCPLPRRAALRTSLKIQATSDKQSVKLPEPISPPALINASPKNDTVIHDFTKKAAMCVAVCAAVGLAASPAHATAGLVAADTAWVLTSTALVLFMTVPGLSAFYGGLVKRDSVLSVLMQCFAITCLMSVLWVVCGYSLSFSTVGMVEGARGLPSIIGGLDKAFLTGVTAESLTGTIPEALWCLFQMTFAIITPALMVGSFVQRMKFNAVMWYVFMWAFAVYFPACHMVWGGAGGFFADMGVLDFAGGIVVHITAGIGALVGAIMLGPRKENKLACGNITLTCLGTGMLWVGWYGFNGGSAIAAGSGAAYAALSTQISAATAALVWMLQDIAETGKASLVGICTGSIAGLAAITPASGFTGPLGALCMGVLSAVVCRFFSTTIKETFNYDDSLDVFGVHGVGGFLGTCLLGILGHTSLGGFNAVPMMQQTKVQCIAAVATALYTAVASFVCLKITSAITGGLRVPVEAEEKGLDMYSHDEIQTPYLQ